MRFSISLASRSRRSLFRRARRAQWQAQTSPTDVELRGLSVVSPTVVWASGQRGTVVHTTRRRRALDSRHDPRRGRARPPRDRRDVGNDRARDQHRRLVARLSHDGRRTHLVAPLVGDAEGDLPRRDPVLGRAARHRDERSGGRKAAAHRDERRWRELAGDSRRSTAPRAARARAASPRAERCLAVFGDVARMDRDRRCGVGARVSLGRSRRGRGRCTTRRCARASRPPACSRSRSATRATA